MIMDMLRKPSNCKCGQTHREKGDRWVVIERRESPRSSHLKCLDCGWKWWSNRKYAASLRDHVEKSLSGMTDEDILQRITDRKLFVVLDTARVFSFRNNSWAELTIIERESNGSTYRFVKINHNSKQKKIALHRLVWMFANKQIVPDGYDVDHVNGKGIQYPDAISNLRLLDSSRNRSRGKPCNCATEELPFEEVPF